MSTIEKRPCRLVMFSGYCVDISKDNVQIAETADKTLRAVAIASSRIPRWNGHLRLPLALFEELDKATAIPANRIFDNGLEMEPYEDLELYVSYAVMHHSLLVDRIICQWAEQDILHGHDIRQLRLQALLHEIGENIISDIPGPFKAIPEVRGAVKPIERHVEECLAHTIGVDFPWDPIIKSADILAQDIEGYFGYKEHHRDVNVSSDFSYENWMKSALVDSAAEGPVDFYHRVLQLLHDSRDK